MKSIVLACVVLTVAGTLSGAVRYFPDPGARAFALDGGRIRQGLSGLAVDVAPNRSWSGARIALAKTFDATAYDRLVAVVSNRTDAPQEIVFQAKCPSNPHCFVYGSRVVPARACGRIDVPIAAASLPLPFDLPGLRGYEPDVVRMSPAEIRNIGTFSVFRRREPRPAAFTLLSVEAEPAADGARSDWRTWKEDAFFPFVDRFGQFRRADWPGKTHTERDLAAARADEDAWLAAHGESPISGADRFGGWAKGPQRAATGSFRTEKVKGKWWLVDPDGHLFYSHGIAGVRVGSETGVSGRERFFEWLPARDDPAFKACWRHCKGGAARSFYRNFGPYDAFSFAEANCRRKYGLRWTDDFAPRAHRRLRAWGVNTIGNWSDARVMAPGRTPYVDWIESHGRVLTVSRGHAVPDVFAPEFATNLDKAAARRAKRSGRDPWCLGWFVDNEICWSETDDGLARLVLAAPSNQPARIAFVQRLAAKGLDAANVPYAELCAFSRAFEARYFSTVRAVVRKHAPDKLYLGCRFLAKRADAVWRVASKYCDVVSVNVYRDEPSVDLPEGAEDKPILIGEFHFGALDRGLLHTGLVPVADQRARADAYRRYVRAAQASNRIVGAHWFLWRDQALTGRSDGECFQVGFVDVTDRPYPEMVEASRDLARGLYPSSF